MGKFEQIVSHLPSLYAPETGFPAELDDLFTALIRAFGAVMDRIGAENAEVMQSHWFNYADSGLYSPWLLRKRFLKDQHAQAPKQGDADVRNFPYLSDLPHLAALVPLVPWEQPPYLKEKVEDFRLRARRTVRVYSQGLGTPQTLRRMVEAQLPSNADAPGERRDRPFFLEEFAPLVATTVAALPRAGNSDLVGPLMRFSAENPGVGGVGPEIFVQGQAASAAVDATSNPLIEHFPSRLGIAYKDTVAPGKTLHLRPAFCSYLVQNSGLLASASSSDPAAPGPWQALAGAPASASATCRTRDAALWAASGDKLFRFDGRAWTTPVTGLPNVLSLLETRNSLAVGTEKGLFSVDLYPTSGTPAAVAAPGLETRKVYAMATIAGVTWAATDQGAFVFEEAPPRITKVLDGDLRTISSGSGGELYFGGPAGASWYFPKTKRAWWLEAGGERGKDQWRDMPVGTAFLPGVNAILRTADSSLWLGTANGIARFIARSTGGFVYEPVLEAFPELTTGVVFSIRRDERGMVWFATDRGLMRFDGRDWWQWQGAGWAQLFNENPQARGRWRFNRATGQWERWDDGAGKWATPGGGNSATQTQPAVRDVFWLDRVVAEVGDGNPSNFANPTPIDPSKLVMRFKPDEGRILNGGIPAIPRMMPGDTRWRYLSMETGPITPPPGRLFWTTEGRMILPPPAHAVEEGRYNDDFDEVVFAYKPAARVWMVLKPSLPCAVLVRLKRLSAGENIDPAIVDRVKQGIELVRPAAVRVAVAVEEEIK